MPSATARMYSGDFPLRRWILTRGIVARGIVAALVVLCGVAALGGASLGEIALPGHDGTLRIAVVGAARLQTAALSRAVAAARPLAGLLRLRRSCYRHV